MTHTGCGARCFAWCWRHGYVHFESRYQDLKAPLLTRLRGEVLEIGPGAGINLRYYAGGVRLLGVEPNPHMRKYLARAALASPVAVRVEDGIAEALPAPDASMDAVVSTLVLCSVDDQARALSEILRVLKPGGCFCFVEHVAAPSGTLSRRAQHFLAPVWSTCGDGCRPDRETGKVIAEAGFTRVDCREIHVGHLSVVSPHIAGSAWK